MSRESRRSSASSSRPIPAKVPGIRVHEPSSHRESIVELASSLAASFTDPSPIAQEALARDLAELPDSEAADEDVVGEESDEDPDAAPYLYRRPSGIAFGTSRPALAIAPIEDSPLSKVEKKQSRDAERSLLRDNHILPPKHPIVKPPSLLKHLYKRVFSTKVPRPEADEEAPGSLAAPTEASPLLHTIDSPTGAAVRDHLNEQWGAAVSAGAIKTTWQREAKTISVYSRSLIVTFLLQYSINICSIFAVGRIGKLELGAVSLATMTVNITYMAPVQGLATCLDTLCSQAFGSGHKTLVGLQVQRMVCFLLLATLPVAVIWWNSIEILAALLPERQSAELAGRYMRVLIVGMPAFVFFECGKRYVQSQGLFTANTYVLFIAAPVNVFLNWFFVWHLEFGFLGAPTAVVITQWLMPTLLLLYIIFVDGSQCWGGFSNRVFSNWGPMIKLALPGMIMVEAEFFAFEILTLASGRMGTSELAAQSILVAVSSTTYQIPFPVSIAASTRVANLIGAKLPDAARLCAKVAVVGALLIGLFNLVVVGAFRYQIPLAFTDDPAVLELVGRTMPTVAVMQVFDGLCAVSHGLLRGVGRQEIGGYANLLTYYLVALPISFAVTFRLGWGLPGLWFGVTIGLLLVSVVEYSFLYRYDWNHAVEEAERRNATG